MPTLVLRFPGGRYHATPWGHHVNEGLIEWPPSPWRLLRALLSVGYTALGWPAAPGLPPTASRPPEAAQRLLGKLASVLPDYALPPARGAHSRHYMPLAVFKGDREHTTLVFDTWARIDRGALAVRWGVLLTADETELLRELAGHLNYLGRSESWVQAELADADADADDGDAGFDFNCRHELATGGSGGPGWEQVALLAPTPAGDYVAWREAAIAQAMGEVSAAGLKGTALRNRQVAAQAPFPDDGLACLQADTGFLRHHGWSQPPGSRRVFYWRRADALRAAPQRTAAPAAPPNAVVAVLLALASQSGNAHALPSLTRGLPQGEMLHAQLVALRMRQAPQSHSPVLTGCDAQRQPLRGSHGHAHVLSLDLDSDQHIDHLLVWAPDGLDALDLQAIRAVRHTYTRGGVGPLRLAWAGAGRLADLLTLPGPLGRMLARSIGTGRQWRSVTPFVPPRHLKPRGANAWQGQVQAELASRCLPAAQTLALLPPADDEHARRLRHHVRCRRSAAAPPVDVGLVLQLGFSQPVSGPLCLGYGSHFGLGRFECVDDD